MRQLTLTALLMAMVTVATMLIQVPVPATKGFINVGDTVIFVAALMFGPRTGVIAGGVGSALADLLSGYAHWAPWTLSSKVLRALSRGRSPGAHTGRAERFIHRQSRVSRSPPRGWSAGTTWQVAR